MTHHCDFQQTCFFPPLLSNLHCREHHISPHFGQQGKFDPAFLQVAQHAWTENFDVSSSDSSTGCSDLCLIMGDCECSRTGVCGPAEEGALGKYSDSVYEDGVRHIDGMVGESGGGDESRCGVCASPQIGVTPLGPLSFWWCKARNDDLGGCAAVRMACKDRREEEVGVNEPNSSSSSCGVCNTAGAGVGGIMTDRAEGGRRWHASRFRK